MKTEVNEDMDTYNGEFPCEVCDKVFLEPSRLTKHLGTHSINQSINSVNENLRLHPQERPYQCTICERSFEHSGKLHRHMRIHTGERPHSCKSCNKTFIQSGQLVIHMRTHTGEKPYVCGSCSKGFTCSKQLKVHMRTHTGEKPYHCDICGKRFGYNHVLKLHQLQHYGCRVYKCTLCSSTFSSKKHMEQHIVTHEEGAAPRPSSTGSTLSQTSSEKDSSRSSLRYLPFYPYPSSSPAVSPPPSLPFLLPSINTICPDPVEPRFQPRRSIIRKNPLYPVTLPLIKSVMEEDRIKFGSLPVLKSPPMHVLLGPLQCGQPTYRPASPEQTPINLTVSISRTEPETPSTPLSSPLNPLRSPPPPSFASMKNSSLPPRKRRVESPVPEPGCRSSVIQFAIRG